MTALSEPALEGSAGFFVTGGTLPRDAACYLRREADDDLFDHLQAGEFCYVLTARQMGKSSLMVRTAARLREAGCAAVSLDLTALGINVTADQWYLGQLRRIGRQLEIEDELTAFWNAPPNRAVGPFPRWMHALTDVVLARVPGRRIVLFVDEIDIVRSLPFSTDEFFAGIRAWYNRRPDEPELSRLAFCLLGVATPSDLIQDTRNTPFNIGHRIELRDFTLAEVLHFAPALAPPPVTEGDPNAADAARQLMERVYHWTNGHPYLTQRLCRAVGEGLKGRLGPLSPFPFPPLTGEGVYQNSLSLPIGEEAGAGLLDTPSPVNGGKGKGDRGPSLPDVDALCADLFFARGAREADDNLLFVRERLLRSGDNNGGDNNGGSRVDVVSVLDAYRRLLRNKPVPDDENSPVAAVLRLSGIAAREPATGVLRVRNRIYRTAFNDAWAVSRMPDAELQRQRRAYRLGLARALSGSGVVVALVGGLAISTYLANGKTRRAETLVRRELFAADMNLAEAAYEQNNLARFTELLDAHKADPLDSRRVDYGLLRALADNARETFPAVLGNKGAVATVVSRDGKTLFAADLVSRALVVQPLLSSGTAAVISPQLLVPTGAQTKLWAAAFSPDQRTAAVAGTGREILVCDAATGKAVLPPLPTASQTTALAFAPGGGSLLASADSEGAVQVWKVHAPSGPVASPPQAGHREAALALAYSPDGQTLASAGYGGEIVLRDGATGRARQVLTGHRGTVYALSFTPDNKRLLSGGKDGTVRLWDAAASGSGKPLRTLQTKIGQRILTVAPLTADGEIVAGAGRDNAIHVWDTRIGNEIAALRGHDAPITTLTTLPSSSGIGAGFVSTSEDGAVRVWDMPAFRRSPPAAAGDRVFAGAISPDGSRTATVWESNRFAVRIRATGSSGSGAKAAETLPQAEVTIGHPAARFTWSVAFSPDNQTLATGSGDGSVRLWDSRTGTPRTPPVGGNRGEVHAVAFSPDGRFWASGDSSGRIVVRDPRTGAALRPITLPVSAAGTDAHSGGGGNDVSRLVFSPDHQTLLATCDGSGILYCINPETGSVVPRHVLGDTGGSESGLSLPAVAYSPDGKWIAVGSNDKTIVILNSAGKVLHRLRGHREAAACLAFSPDSRTLVSGGSEGAVKLWDVALGRETLTLPHASGSGNADAAGAAASAAPAPVSLSEIHFAPDSSALVLLYANGDLAMQKILSAPL